MSFLTATNTELIYNMPTAGSDITSSTASIFTANTTTNPPAYLPPLFSIWQPSTVAGKGFSVRLGGTFDQGAGNSNTFKYGLNTTQATTTPAVVLAQTGSTPWTNTTAGLWHAQIDTVVTSSGIISASVNVNVYTDGFLVLGPANGTTTGTVIALAAAANTTPTTIGLVGSQAYWWEGSFTWGTAPTHSACQKHMIFGLN